MESDIEQKLVGFFKKYKLIKYNKGEIIFRPGDVFSDVSFVKNGYVRLFRVTKNGKETTINLFKPVFYLSLMFSNTNYENQYLFEAITDIELWKCPNNDIKRFFKKNPEVSEWLNISLLKILNDVLANVGDTVSGNSCSKILSIILSLVSHFGVETPDGISIDFLTSHRILASLAGIARETASIQIKKLERQGLIRQINRRIVVPDLQKLKDSI